MSHFLLSRSLLSHRVVLSPLSLSLFSVPLRSLSMWPTPVGPRDPDNIYRRPAVPAPRSPLSEDDELVWSDGQAPEPALDRFNHLVRPSSAVMQLLIALSVTIGVGLLVAKTLPSQVAEKQVFPFNELEAELGKVESMGPAATAATQQKNRH